MRKYLVMAAGMLMCLSASAQFYYQDSKNVEMLRHSEYRTPVRTEILIPQVCGYNVYKSDLHTHSVYSDGTVTPQFRVKEAWLDGLDVIAVTEHIEYRPFETEMAGYLGMLISAKAKSN